jgi:hypothetical protein
MFRLISRFFKQAPEKKDPGPKKPELRDQATQTDPVTILDEKKYHEQPNSPPPRTPSPPAPHRENVYIYVRSARFDPAENPASYYLGAYAYLLKLSALTDLEVFNSLTAAIEKNPTLINNEDYIAQLSVPIGSIQEIKSEAKKMEGDFSIQHHFRMLQQGTVLTLENIHRLYPAVRQTFYPESQRKLVAHAMKHGIAPQPPPDPLQAQRPASAPHSTQTKKRP